MMHACRKVKVFVAKAIIFYYYIIDFENTQSYNHNTKVPISME